MAYKPGSQIRNFLRDGGITLTDKSPNYKSGKIPLFKSLKNLNAKERLYAVGYNFATLGAFGLDIGSALSVPYLIGEYTNTARSFIRNMKNPSAVMSGDIIKRQKLLGGAKYVNHAKRAVTHALRTNTPIDRATSIIIGRESAGMLQNIREFGAGGSALKIIQEANSQKMDAEILRQANIPSKQNVFRKWQVLTFTEAFKNAPDPFRDNPIRKAEKIRHKTVKKNKAEFNIEDVTMRHNIGTGLNVDRAQELMSFADLMIIKNHPGIQEDLVEALLDAESAKYFKGTKYESYSTKARIKQMEEARYKEAGAIMRSGSQRTVDYDEKTLFEVAETGSLRNDRGIEIDKHTQMGSTINSRQLGNELDKTFKDSIVNDLKDVPLENLNAFQIGPEIVPALRDLAQAFNHPFGQSRFGGISGANLSDILSSILTTVSADDFRQDFFRGVEIQVTALDEFRKILRKNGYKQLGDAVYNKAGYFYEGSDKLRMKYRPNSALRERNELRRHLNKSLHNGLLYQFLMGDKAAGDIGYRFRPSGSMIDNTKYAREILNRKKGKNLAMHRSAVQRILIDARGNASSSGKIKLGFIERFQQKVLKKRNYTTDPISGDTKVSFDMESVTKPGHDSGRLLTYNDFFMEQVPGMKPVIDSNGKFKGLFFGHPYDTLGDGDKIMGKTKQWWTNKVGKMHTEYIGLAKKHLGLKRYDDKRIYEFMLKGNSDQVLDKLIKKNYDKGIEEFTKAWNPSPGTGMDAFVKNVEPGSGKGDFKGVSNARRSSHNFVPLKEQIRASIHMHDLERYGKNENDGTPFLFRFSVSAGGKNKTSKHADAIRDIRSIEFGGMAHDKNMQREKRTDGMVYFPSNFMGISGTKAAAYLGIWDKGSEFKTNVDGASFVAKIKSEGSISPFDLKSDGGNNKDRIYTRQHVSKLKQEVTQGSARLKKLERDIAKVMRDGARTNSSFNSEGARIAQQRALALYRETGEFGSINAGDVFKMMDSDMRNNLSMTGDKFGSNYMFNISKLGYYSKVNNNKFIGSLNRETTIHDITHSYSSGNNTVGRMYTQQMMNRETGETMYGQMPEVPISIAEFNNMKSSFTNIKPGEPGKPARITTDWEAFEDFTGVSRNQLYALNEQAKTAGAIPMKFNNYTLETQINPSDDSTVRRLLRSPIEEIVAAFGLDKVNGPLSTVNGGKIPINSPAHPSNLFQKIFLSGEMTKHIVYESRKIMMRQTSVLRSKSTDAGKKMIEQKITEASIEAGRSFDRYLNKTLKNNLFRSPELHELDFRKTLQSLAFMMRASILNAGHEVRNIKLRYGRVKAVDKEAADALVVDGKLDLDTFDADKFMMVPDEMGFKLVQVDDQMQIVRDLDEKLHITEAERAMMELYDPVQALNDSFSIDPGFGTAGPKIVRDLNYNPENLGFNNIASQSRAKQILQGIASEMPEGQRDNFLNHITELYDANATEALRRAGVDFDSGGGKVLGKTYHGISADVDGVERVVIENYRGGKTLKGASDQRVADFMTAGMVKKRERINLHKKARDNYPAYSVAIDYWKNFRHGYSPTEKYNELIQLVHTRLSAPLSSKKDIAALFREIWIGTAKPKMNVRKGKRVYEGFLNIGKSAVADNLNTLPPEYNHMEQVLTMLGFTGGKRITTKQRGHQVLELEDKDFMKIAELLIEKATAGRRGVAGRRYSDGIFREFNAYEELKRIYGSE